MKPKLAALNVLLIATAGVTIWQGAVRWNAAQTLRQTTLNVPVKPVPAPTLIPKPQPETPPATKYAEVADNNLFSADRDSKIVVEPPPVVIAKPMPPLPVATGVMKLPSGVRAFMTAKQGEPVHAVKADDTVGEFKIVALDEQNVTFDWDGKKITRKIDDLIDRTNHNQTASNTSNAPAAVNTPPPPPQPQVNTQTSGKQYGVDLTDIEKACKPGDASPPGTVENGFKKVVTPSIFGPVCRWMKQ